MPLVLKFLLLMPDIVYNQLIKEDLMSMKDMDNKNTIKLQEWIVRFDGQIKKIDKLIDLNNKKN